MTKRQAIDLLREELRKRNADARYSNQFLYRELITQAKWLIKREIVAGRIYKNTFFFQTLKCQRVIETSLIDPCCPIKTNCKIYRLECKIPDVWIDNDGPIIKSISSIDGPAMGSTDFWLTTPSTWENKKKDPYQKKSKQLYTFYADGYFWFPEVNPHRVNIHGFWADDITHLNGCAEKEECVRYLDTRFTIPDWLEAEMFMKAATKIAGISERIPEDEQIDKNPTRKS